MIVPGTQPRQGRERTEFLLSAAGVDPAAGVALVGVRGYYLDTMGAPRVNDRGIYDDAIFICSPDAHASFNANTDPSVTRPGVAVLKAGLWTYQRGKHRRNDPKGYPALVQAAPVTVTRDEKGEETGWFGINIHRGSLRNTSSLGCQTIYPTQWQAFMNLVVAETVRWKQAKIPYLLVENS